MSNRKDYENASKRNGENDYLAGSFSLIKAKGASVAYQKFSDLIIEKLEQGVLPWKQPWHEMTLPSNYLTKKS